MKKRVRVQRDERERRKPLQGGMEEGTFARSLSIPTSVSRMERDQDASDLPGLPQVQHFDFGNLDIFPSEASAARATAAPPIQRQVRPAASLGAPVVVQRLKETVQNKAQIAEQKTVYLKTHKNQFKKWDTLLGQARDIEHLKQLVEAAAPVRPTEPVKPTYVLKKDKHGIKHTKLSHFSDEELLRKTKNGDPATFFSTYANRYDELLFLVIPAAVTANTSFVDMGVEVGIDAGERTNVVELYYGESGSHMRPRKTDDLGATRFARVQIT